MRPLDGVKNVYHSGSTAGYRAHLNRFPDSHTSVAVLCNGSDGKPREQPMSCRASTLVKRTVVDHRRDDRGVSGGVPRRRRRKDADLNEFVGDYWSDEAETKFTAMVDKGRLVLRRRPGMLIELEQTGKDTFRGQQLGTVTFRRNAAGRGRGAEHQAGSRVGSQVRPAKLEWRSETALTLTFVFASAALLAQAEPLMLHSPRRCRARA